MSKEATRECLRTIAATVAHMRLPEDRDGLSKEEVGALGFGIMIGIEYTFMAEDGEVPTGSHRWEDAARLLSAAMDPYIKHRDTLSKMTMKDVDAVMVVEKGGDGNGE
ncbi:MAG: hypothetical protein IKG69_00460 [Atopobiaceae bacterium]|nr:hypothetical protein [Atopobiaceae bacterium]